MTTTSEVDKEARAAAEPWMRQLGGEPVYVGNKRGHGGVDYLWVWEDSEKIELKGTTAADQHRGPIHKIHNLEFRQGIVNVEIMDDDLFIQIHLPSMELTKVLVILLRKIPLTLFVVPREVVMESMRAHLHPEVATDNNGELHVRISVFFDERDPRIQTWQLVDSVWKRIT